MSLDNGAALEVRNLTLRYRADDPPAVDDVSFEARPGETLGLLGDKFVEITSAGIRESHVHDVQITKEAPNYRAD